jgi:hypothetical protein
MRKALAIFLCLILTTTILVIPAPSKALKYNMDSKLSNADASFWGEKLNDDSGSAMANVGDVNGDGYDDLLIGAYGNADGGSRAGQTYLILGKASGWARDTSLSNAAASFWGEATDDESGYAVAGAGDVNGDGFDDILIGAQWNDEGTSDAGQTYLLFGKATGWAMDTSLSKANASFLGEHAGDYSGGKVAGAGDVNGDGYDDFLIGAVGNDEKDSGTGQTYLILGKASGWAMDTDLSKADASFRGEVSGDSIGSLGRFGVMLGDAGEVEAPTISAGRTLSSESKGSSPW